MRYRCNKYHHIVSHRGGGVAAVQGGSPMKLVLYQSNVSPGSTRVRICARVKGIDLDMVEVSALGDTSPEYLAKNPLGATPCMEADGRYIVDPDVICEYLEETFPGRNLLPADPLDRAQSRTVSRLVDLLLPRALEILHYQLDPSTRDQAIVDKGHAEVAKALDLIAKFVDGPVYAVGGALSLADCALMPHLFFVGELVTTAFGRPSMVTGRLADYVAAIVGENSYVAQAIEEMRVGVQAMR
jgi:glutathione S-transferase